jgi:hypothetical protein
MRSAAALGACGLGLSVLVCLSWPFLSCLFCLGLAVLGLWSWPVLGCCLGFPVLPCVSWSCCPGFPVLACRFEHGGLRGPNASLQLLPEAGATEERRLEAVSCKALLGQLCYETFRDDFHHLFTENDFHRNVELF